MQKIKWLIVVIALALLTGSIVYRLNFDSRYSGWSRYSDSKDGYEVMAPPEWSILEETSIAGFRGARVFQTEDYPTDLGTLSVFSVYTRDQNGNPVESEEMRQIAERIARADLKELRMTATENSELPAEFTFSGTAFIESIPVTGRVRFQTNDSTLLVAISILPDARKEELESLFSLIHESVKFSADTE
jgi:hypothetical protein